MIHHKSRLLFLVTMLLSSLYLYGQNVVYLRNETYNNDKTIKGDKVVFERNGSIRLNNAAILSIIATEIEVQSVYVIDAKGVKGTDATGTLPDWCAHNCNCGFHNQGQSDWEKAGGETDRGNKGGNGTNGGSVFITYCQLSGIEGGFGNLRVQTNGGQGGAGGIGRKLINPCVDWSQPMKYKFGPTGHAGDNGKDGIFRYSLDCTPLTNRSEFTIDAKSSWLNTGITVRANSTLIVNQISGAWSVDNANYPLVNGDGHTNESSTALANFQDFKALKSAYFGSLIGKIGGNSPFKIGSNFQQVMSQTGTLYLQINDLGLGDNGGSITVSVLQR
ncbi:MAG: hypothetical protein V9F46_13235 [Chitinophagaceae bacterium]